MDFVLTAEINEASTDVIICSKDHQYMRNNKLNYWKILASILKKHTQKKKMITKFLNKIHFQLSFKLYSIFRRKLFSILAMGNNQLLIKQLDYMLVHAQMSLNAAYIAFSAQH